MKGWVYIMITTKNVDRSILPPMLLQYIDIKDSYPNDIVLFRVGDFFEAYFEDAVPMSTIGEVRLTAKKVGAKDDKSYAADKSEKDLTRDEIVNSKLMIPMAGVPHKCLYIYAQKIINAGKRVVVVEQLEDPKSVKGRNIKRGVIKILSSMEKAGEYLDEYLNNYICIIYKELNNYSLCFADISTNDVLCTTVDSMDLVLSEIARYNPSEVLVNSEVSSLLGNQIETKLKLNVMLTIEDTMFTFESSFIDKILKSFSIKSIDDLEYINFSELKSLCALINYIEYTQRIDFSFGKLPEFYDYNNYMSIDLYSHKNLELCESLTHKTRKGTLINVLNDTKTSMGSRLLKKWIDAPLLSKAKIEYRLDAVTELLSNIDLLKEIQNTLFGVLDISRIVNGLKLRRTYPKDLVSLRDSLHKVPAIYDYLSKFDSPLMKELLTDTNKFEALTFLLDNSILDEPCASVEDGLILKSGYNSSLDTARDMVTNATKYITELEAKERLNTGIKNLRVIIKSGVCCIEVTKGNINKVPENYIVEKPLKNATRYITSETKTLEKDLNSATERSKSLELELYNEIKDSVLAEHDKLMLLCEALSTLDVLCSLASVALKNNYVRPQINKDGYIKLVESRHPVVEKSIKEEFISNNVNMDLNNNFMLITGPNMAGKSTYMRQVALIVIMAHIGSYVPALSADIPIIDKIFTRIGASDDISSGRSTYMVEMVEVKNILDNATKNSLVLLDEVGRGTSTSDGLSIAQSLVEYISNNIGCKTLFATHYHELIFLEKSLPNLKNYHMSVSKDKGTLKFLRKLEKGGLSESYGIDVAELAGIPSSVIARAWDILNTIEGNKNYVVEPERKDFSENAKIIETLKGLNKSEISPVMAYKTLCDLIDMCN